MWCKEDRKMCLSFFGLLIVVATSRSDQVSHIQRPAKPQSLSYGSIPGEPEADYPILSSTVDTEFVCPGIPGYYADIDTRCQMFHICQQDGRHNKLLCPNGTVFNQPLFTCDWWFNVDCPSSSIFYDLNRRLHFTSGLDNADMIRVEQHEAEPLPKYNYEEFIPAFQRAPEEPEYDVSLYFKWPQDQNNYTPPRQTVSRYAESEPNLAQYTSNGYFNEQKTDYHNPDEATGYYSNHSPEIGNTEELNGQKELNEGGNSFASKNSYTSSTPTQIENETYPPAGQPTKANSVGESGSHAQTEKATQAAGEQTKQTTSNHFLPSRQYTLYSQNLSGQVPRITDSWLFLDTYGEKIEKVKTEQHQIRLPSIREHTFPATTEYPFTVILPRRDLEPVLSQLIAEPMTETETQGQLKGNASNILTSTIPLLTTPTITTEELRTTEASTSKPYRILESRLQSLRATAIKALSEVDQQLSSKRSTKAHLTTSSTFLPVRNGSGETHVNDLVGGDPETRFLAPKTATEIMSGLEITERTQTEESKNDEKDQTEELSRALLTISSRKLDPLTKISPPPTADSATTMQTSEEPVTISLLREQVQQNEKTPDILLEALTTIEFAEFQSTTSTIVETTTDTSGTDSNGLDADNLIQPRTAVLPLVITAEDLDVTNEPREVTAVTDQPDGIEEVTDVTELFGQSQNQDVDPEFTTVSTPDGLRNRNIANILAARKSKSVYRKANTSGKKVMKKLDPVSSTAAAGLPRSSEDETKTTTDIFMEVMKRTYKRRNSQRETNISKDELAASSTKTQNETKSLEGVSTAQTSTKPIEKKKKYVRKQAKEQRPS